jgi:hypothetical protein
MARFGMGASWSSSNNCTSRTAWTKYAICNLGNWGTPRTWSVYWIGGWGAAVDHWWHDCDSGRRGRDLWSRRLRVGGLHVRSGSLCGVSNCLGDKVATMPNMR